MTAILTDNGDLLIPVDFCVAAERVPPGDPRYPELLETAIREEDLQGTPEEDATLAAEFEDRFLRRQTRSA